MLAILSDALNIPLSKSHREHKPSDTGLKLVWETMQESLSDVVENKHTDSGTLTILFCEQWGTQLQLPDTGNWAFAQPMEGCALVNVAYSLQRLSGGRLHSCLHRVTQPGDGALNRVFVLYFLRPEKAGGA
jgi:isopenicillin N synthase-like dioxygenase